MALGLLSGCQPASAPGPETSDTTADPNSALLGTPAASSQASPVPAVATPQAIDPALAVDSEGLRLFDRITGSARPLLFGMPWAQVTRALAFRGPASTGIIGECGAGALDYASWPDGLTLYAQDGELIGWALDERANGALGTAANVGPGRTRRDLESAYSAEFSQTTLGTEFAAGGVYGVLDGPGPSALITAMWGGTSCNFR